MPDAIRARESWSAARDIGPSAKLDSFEPERSNRHAWRFWTFDWGMPVAGEHQIRSRATDVDGNVQPAPDDAYVASRRTFWENNGHITRRVRIG